jgi:hypothetical protein
MGRRRRWSKRQRRSMTSKGGDCNYVSANSTPTRLPCMLPGIVPETQAVTGMTAFLLTWKQTGWPHENIVRMVTRQQENGYVDEPWRIAAYKAAKPGDRVWALRQGRGPKGIFGVGRISGPPAIGPAGNGETRMMAPVRFEAFVDPLQRLLIGEDAVTAVLRPSQIRAQASGYPIDDGQSDALEKLLTTDSPLELSVGGGNWTEDEVTAIVGDYFAMLDDELAGRPYSKTAHRNALRVAVNRSPGSIERKHQNISAVLQELGLPWIRGYKPLGNFQDALLNAVVLKLRGTIERLDGAAIANVEPPADVSMIFVPAPSAGTSTARSNRPLVGKFDPAARDAANHALGTAGEDYVLRLERQRLKALGYDELATKVAWVADEIGDGLGYDIVSFGDDGNPIFIEVKTTKGPITTPFFVTENERRVAAAKGAAFRIYRLIGFGTDPKVYSLSGPLEASFTLEPLTYRARVISG